MDTVANELECTHCKHIAYDHGLWQNNRLGPCRIINCGCPTFSEDVPQTPTFPGYRPYFSPV